MEKTNQNLLQKLTQILNVEKIISPEDIQEIRGVLVGVLANNKKEVESLTAETRELVNKVLNKVLDEHDTYLEKTKQIAQEAKSDTTEAIQATMKSLEEVKNLCKEVMDCKPENGKDADEEYVIGEVLNRIKLPEYKEVVLDDGGAIVDKINSLPVNEENQIDAKHIKNLPEIKGGRVISGGVTRKIVEQMIEAAVGGSGSGDVTGPASSTDNAIARFDGTTGKLIQNSVSTIDDNGIFSTTSAIISGTNGNGHINLRHQASDAVATGQSTALFANSLGDIEWKNDGNYYTTLQTSSNTADRVYTFLNSSYNVLGSTSALTTGSVLFANSSGLIAQDNSNLFWDDTNNRLGIGTATPLTKLHLSGGDGSTVFTTATIALGFSTTGQYPHFIHTRHNNAAILNSIDFYTSDGVAAGVYPTNAIHGMTISNRQIGLQTTDPTHTLTLASTSTGIALYNTADQTTNFERIVSQWSGNQYNIYSTSGGTGLARAISIGSSSIFFKIEQQATSPKLNGTWGGTGVAVGVGFTGSLTASSGTQIGLSLTPTLSQSSTAGYTALLINPTETTTGSGTKLLADFQVGGSSKAKIDNTGLITSPQIINTPATITVTTNAGTVTRANRVNNFTNSSAAAMTITMSTTSAADGDMVMVRIKDFSAVAQTITWVNTENSTVSAPTTSNGSTTLPLTVGFQYNSATSKWRCIASA